MFFLLYIIFIIKLILNQRYIVKVELVDLLATVFPFSKPASGNWGTYHIIHKQFLFFYICSGYSPFLDV